MTNNLYLLWAKLPKEGKGSRAFHPLICHMLDVAVVARLMWRRLLPDAARQRIAESLKLSAEETERWVVYLAALHDLGKASPAFQLRKEAAHLFNIYAALGKPPNIEAKDCPHGRVTAGELPQILEEEFGIEKPVSDRLAVIIGGHHGTFPTSHELLNRYPDAGVGRTNKWEGIRRELARRLARLFGVSNDSVPRDCDHASAMFIAGLVSVADWVGSNSDFFPYLVNDFESMPTLDPAEYLLKAETSAEQALNRLGWMGWRQPEARLAFSQLFNFISSPRPLQQAAVETADKFTPPGIVIVEAPMGEGKTEAALYLADYWGVAPGPRGCYVALPTQATSNQMFTRVRDFLSARYPADRVNLQLLHGHAALSSEFRLLRENGDRAFDLESVCGEEGCGEHGASVVAAEWFTHRKRGLLAPFGVGTVDQALLATLQTRHVFVRLFGLAHKVVIVDEVHAYDAYMSKLLERLLEWLAALGSPVALLSATLPNEKRTALLKAYLRGLNRELSAEEERQLDARYPRLSWANATAQGAQTIEVSDHIRRKLKIEWMDESVALGQRLKDVLADGGCAAVICNTVNRAQQVYLSLKPYFDAAELDLFHARYLFKDRDEREKRALSDFGKDGATIKFDDDEARTVRRPYRKVLVATQVIEQSLDLDFDLMVTDCAPVDLILQRSGRLHRHERARPEKLSQPTLWVRQPESVEDGAPKFDLGSEAVYDAHVLLRSWWALRDRSEIEIPAQIEELIEFVYGEQSCPDSASDALREHWLKTAAGLREDLKRMEAEAQRVVVPEPTYPDDILDLSNKRLEEDEPEIHKSLQALTRLTEPNVSVICLSPEQRRRFNLTKAPNVSVAKDLLRYSVTLNSKRVVWALLAQKPHAAWVKSALLRRYRLLELDEAGCCEIGKYRLQVHPELGVIINESERESFLKE
ncbi:MAG: CRISPR-associated endonuclease/helicase Cas3 [Gammaproteobacteria bacterium]|nr:CRISPR-associated endonuclease/helicase Cas3 [Gammaproteobacteria bacterium]